MADDGVMNIYRASRTIKRRDNSLYNALRSIYEDSIFVSEIAQIWPELPLIANLRCGLWYSNKFHSSCYFKSTDGHTNNLSFNTSRLNLHVAHLAGQRGGCMIVDSTRKGKRFPDSMSKTIPIWICVLNRAILSYRNKMAQEGSDQNDDASIQGPPDWDSSLHLPLWVPETEKAAIEGHLDEWTYQLEASGADIASLASSLRKSLRPLWISQKTVIWLNEVPDHDSWDFTPIILVSASSLNGVLQQRTSCEFSWNYICGAGDDEESWARGLTPSLFWKNAYNLINSGPDLCNQKVADIVEKDRVYRAHRGQTAPQVSVRPSKLLETADSTLNFEQALALNIRNNEDDGHLGDGCAISWLGSTNLAVCATGNAANIPDFDSILSCDQDLGFSHLENSDSYLHLPIVNSKFDRFSLLKNLPSALNFAKLELKRGKRLVVCCNSGEDISVCICLAIMISLFDAQGVFDDGKSFKGIHISKLDMRQRLIFICKYAVNARPSRGNLRQVFNFLNTGKPDSNSQQTISCPSLCNGNMIIS